MSPAHVLSVYAEPLVGNRRVALLAPENPSLTEALLALGARLLYVYDPREGAAPRRGSDPRVTIAPLRAGDLGVREGAFDVAIVPDLTLLGDPESALAYVRRLVGNHGVALVASRNRDAGAPWARAPEGGPAPSYTDLYDMCALQFAEVRMAGVAPFAAYAIAEFAPDREPSIAFDASLVSSAEPPEWFLAIASQSEVTTLEAYEIIQIPRDALLLEEAAADSEPVTDPGELDALQKQVLVLDHKRQEAEARAGEEVLRADRAANELRTQTEELRKLRDKLQKAQKELEDERRAKQRVETELRSPEISQLRERVLALEAELIEARTQLATPRAAAVDPRLQQERDALANEVATLRSALQQAKGVAEDLRHRLVERERELDATLKRAKGLEDRLEENLAEADQRAQLVEHVRVAETVAERLRQELASVQTTHEEDVSSLESALRTAGEQLRIANVELLRRERMIRDLVSQIEEGVHGGAAVHVPHPPPELLQELDLARRELSTLVEEVRRRDRAVIETRAALEAARRDVENERAKTEQLARDAARREAALQTASWKIAELEAMRSDAEPTPSQVDSELDALRRALQQEHARVEALERELASATEAGSGELRARLQEQETLIKQLSAELAQRQG